MFHIKYCKALKLCALYLLFSAVPVFVYISIYLKVVFFPNCFANSGVNICTNRGE